jgi:hypothetical protein
MPPYDPIGLCVDCGVSSRERQVEELRRCGELRGVKRTSRAPRGPAVRAFAGSAGSAGSEICIFIYRKDDEDERRCY